MGIRLVLVGARSTRQGTGPYVAAALKRAGAEVCAIVGTSGEGVNAARRQLLLDQGIDCAGYTDLEQAIAREQPDAVAICSPWKFHAAQLAVVAAAGCHCLVEKPLVWPADGKQVDTLVAAFERGGLLLQMVAQWPCTLPSFCELHGPLPAKIESFAMRLSPISIGPDMVTDSAPHFISMLSGLLGVGSCEDVLLEFSGDGGDQQLLLQCRYQHPGGSAAAQLLLQTCEQRPRPAWYRINDLQVDREIEMPGYQQYFAAGGRRVALADPIQQVVDDFLDALAVGATGHGALLRGGHGQLLRLAAAWPRGK